MRRPRSTLFATSLAVGLGLSAPIAMAQQRAGNRPAQAGDSSPSPTTIDPMIASRSARTLLRNGLDYLTYQEFEKALTYLRAAESRPKELTSDELAKLSQGIDQARRGLREPNHGRAPVTARSTRKVGSPLRDAEPIELTSGTRVLPPRTVEPANDDPAEVAPTPTPRTTAGRSRGQVPNIPPKPFSNPAPRRVETAAEPTPAPELEPAGPEVPTLETPPVAVAETRAEPEPTPALKKAAAPAVDPELAPAQAPAAIATTPAPTQADAEPARPAEPPALLPGPLDQAEPATPAKPVEARTAPPPANRMPARTPPADFRYPPLPSDAPEPAPAPVPAPDQSPVPTRPTADPELAPAQVPVTVEDEPTGPAEPPAALPTIPAQDQPEPTPQPAAADNEPKPIAARTAPAPANRMPARTPPTDFRYPPLPSDAPAPAPAPSTVPTRPAQARPTMPGPAPAADEIELPPLPPSALIGNGRPRFEPELPPLPQAGGQAPATRRHIDLPPDVQEQIAMIEKRQEEELRQYGPGGRPRDDIGLPSEASSRLVMPRAPSPTEYRPIKAIPTPDDIPVLSPREWSPTRKYWAAAATCHGPLYFQDAALERYGQSVEQALGPIGKYFSYPIDDPRQSNQRRQILQPFASIGLFAFQIAAWPINAVLDPPTEPEYDLGYYRPGDRIPPDTIYLPFTGVGPALRGSHYP